MVDFRLKERTMDASEAFKKPGDVARRTSDGAVGVAYWNKATGKLRVCLTYSDGSSANMPLATLAGDWEPLGPCVDISSLSQYHADGTLLHSSDPRAAFVSRQQVANHCIVDDAKVAELEAENAFLKEEKQTALVRLRHEGEDYRKLEAENAKLRKQLAELRPEPTEAEIPKVPTFKYLGAVMYGETLHMVRWTEPLDGQRGKRLWADYPHHNCPQVIPAGECTLYEGPIEWPDGTVKPVPASDELREALR